MLDEELYSIYMHGVAGACWGNMDDTQITYVAMSLVGVVLLHEPSS